MRFAISKTTTLPMINWSGTAEIGSFISLDYFEKRHYSPGSILSLRSVVRRFAMKKREVAVDLQ